MDILVTGGAGYIGSHTVRRLIGAGHKVTVIDDLSTGNPWAVDKQANFYELALENRIAVREIIKEHAFDAVIHLAASSDVTESFAEPNKYFRNNTLNTANLAMDCVELGVPHLVFSSTAAVYGETAEKPVSEKAPLKPVNPYGRSKKLSEDFIRLLYASNEAGNFAILRYFNVAGACTDGLLGQDQQKATNIFKALTQVAYGEREQFEVFGTDYPTPDGTCIRDFIHVEDVAQAHVDALNYLVNGGQSETMNIGYGHGYSVRQVLETYELCNKIKIPVVNRDRRQGDPPDVVADNQKILSLTGWEPKYDDLSVICKSAHHWEEKLLSAKEG